jgi:hypothetical protein
MKKSIFIALFFIVRPLCALEFCDIADELTRPLTEQSILIWSLLDLAESECIINHELFYDELCQAALKLCKDVQQLQESRYSISSEKLESLTEFFKLIHNKFMKLPEYHIADRRYVHAIDIILDYSDFFLKNNLGINTDIKTTQASF